MTLCDMTKSYLRPGRFIVLASASLFNLVSPAQAEPASLAGQEESTRAQGTSPTGAMPSTVSVEPGRPAVSLVKPTAQFLPDRIEAHGNVMPWQESHIGTEVGGLRLVSVLANVGDVVKKGQVLARLNAETVETELEAADAQLVEAQAALVQAAATLERANRLAPSGGVSRQELTLYETQKNTAEARLTAARAQVRKQQLRLKFATLVAPDDGVISASSAAEGAIVQAGSELFRLIRQGRLEWRAEVKGETLLKLAVGQEVTVKSPLGPEVRGRVRQVSPTIDLKTRNGLVYVDLPPDTNLKAGLNVSGLLTMGKRKVLVLPASAVLRQEGVSRVFKVNADRKIEAVDIQTGEEKDGWVEISSGLDAGVQVVARYGEFQKAGEPEGGQESDGSPVKVREQPGRQ